MGLYFEDFAVGQEWISPSRTVTEADVAAFADVTGDNNPLHLDAEFAKTTQYGQRIAHGVLVLGIASGLKARLNLLDGTALAFLKLNWTFRGPVYFGDAVHMKLTILAKRETRSPEKGIVTQGLQMLNQRGEVVHEGEHVIMVRRRT